jgi:hypothetical protein
MISLFHGVTLGSEQGFFAQELQQKGYEPHEVSCLNQIFTKLLLETPRSQYFSSPLPTDIIKTKNTTYLLAEVIAKAWNEDIEKRFGLNKAKFYEIVGNANLQAIDSSMFVSQGFKPRSLNSTFVRNYDEHAELCGLVDAIITAEMQWHEQTMRLKFSSKRSCSDLPMKIVLPSGRYHWNPYSASARFNTPKYLPSQAPTPYYSYSSSDVGSDSEGN